MVKREEEFWGGHITNFDSIFLRRETWKVSCVVCEEKKFDYHCHVLVFGFRLISASILYSREKITFEDDTAFMIFSNVFYIATPFAIIKVCCVKVFRAVSRSNRVFSHKNNPRRYRANVEEAKVT